MSVNLNRWFLFFSVSKVEVDAGADSVLLPFKTIPNLPKEATVGWRRLGLKSTTVHMYQNSRDRPGKHNVYLERSEMRKDLLETGDLSLNLKNPKDRDSGLYVCTVSMDRRVLDRKLLRLQVRGQCCRDTSQVIV